MLYGNKTEIEKILPLVAPKLQIALRYLLKTDFSKLPNGEYEIDGRNIFAGVNTYITEPYSAKRAEAHNKYIDVQYLGQGTEKIYFCPREERYPLIEDLSQEKDLLFYGEVEEKDAITLQAGDFMILFPWELHRPGCDTKMGSSAVQKIVVKVSYKD